MFPRPIKRTYAVPCGAISWNVRAIISSRRRRNPLRLRNPPYKVATVLAKIPSWGDHLWRKDVFKLRFHVHGRQTIRIPAAAERLHQGHRRNQPLAMNNCRLLLIIQNDLLRAHHIQVIHQPALVARCPDAASPKPPRPPAPLAPWPALPARSNRLAPRQTRSAPSAGSSRPKLR